LNAILYAILGAFLFLLPEKLAPVFAWKVTAFMTMTIGGWCLGNAWLAWFVARRWQWSLVYPALYYLWLFGILELGVLFLFRDKLKLEHPLAWLYFITLIINGIYAVVGVYEIFQNLATRERSESNTNALQYTGLIFFIVFVGFLGIYGCTAKIGAPGTNGGIFPEVMSPFTLRSFGAFYLSLALAVVPLLRDRNLSTFLSHGFVSYGLIIFITTAALYYFRLFDFGAKPGGMLYYGAYLAVAVVFLVNFRKYGIGA
jgi:hypothetical protein